MKNIISSQYPFCTIQVEVPLVVLPATFSKMYEIIAKHGYGGHDEAAKEIAATYNLETGRAYRLIVDWQVQGPGI